MNIPLIKRFVWKGKQYVYVWAKGSWHCVAVIHLPTQPVHNNPDGDF